jgi:tetratricopeptide (TPR) repeat protein
VDLSRSTKTRTWICLALLALVTVGVYWQVRGFGFINFDDPDYVSENPVVSRGLTFQGIRWAFTQFHSSNWHPLTWISHMLDCQLFGLNPAGPHLVNVFFHVANTLLLFLLLQRMTGAQWRSAIVAGLFALHPLHVESVAWISERKDVLSTFFGLLSLLAYAGYCKKSATRDSRSTATYALALTWFALGLMAKPMLVTLPFAMLLLDVWPLQRVENIGWRTFFSRPFLGLVKEKWPWFALVAASCAMTLRAQSAAMTSMSRFSFSARLINAIESYFWYAQKTFLPTKLAVFYPIESVHALGPFIIITLWLIVISCVALATMRRWPFLFFGWFWFVGTLVPVIGLVQVGSQGMADRYSYVPLIGLFIAIVWAAYEVLNRSRRNIVVGEFAATVVLAALATTTFFQVRHWKSTETLFRHAVAVTQDNDTALQILGTAFYELHRDDDALTMYRLALVIRPDASDIHKSIGMVLARKGKLNEALYQYEEAARLAPGDAALQNFLAETLVMHGRNEAALPHFSEAARLKPDNAQYQNDLAVSLATAGKRAEAMPHYERAVQLEPSNAHYQNNFATALARAGDQNGAIQHYRAAIQADPKFAEPYSNLGALLFYRQQFDEAAAQYSEAIRLSPTNAAIRFNAGLVLLKLHRTEDAMAQFTEAARLRPEWPEPLNAHAWALATSSDDKVRNGIEAVKLAEQAVKLTSRQQPILLNTLAAAYAEAGRFDDALATANQALEIANRGKQTNLVVKIERAITLYKSHAPLRENGPAD